MCMAIGMNLLATTQSFGTPTHLLHMNAVEHEKFVFVGYSGCPTNWGLNPIAAELLGGKPVRMEPIAADLEAAFLEYRRKKTQIDRKHERALLRLKASTDSLKSPSCARQLKALIEKRKSEIAEAKKSMNRISSSAEFSLHQTDVQKTSGLKREVLRLRSDCLKPYNGLEQPITEAPQFFAPLRPAKRGLDCTHSFFSLASRALGGRPDELRNE